MSAGDKFRVTVAGTPVSADVSWEQVRAYLRTKGWALGLTHQDTERWDRGESWVWTGGYYHIGFAIKHIADIEYRGPSDVLGDIAGLDSPRCNHCSEFGISVKEGRIVTLWGKDESEQAMSREASVEMALEVLRSSGRQVAVTHLVSDAEDLITNTLNSISAIYQHSDHQKALDHMSSNLEGLRETLRCFGAQFKGAVDEAHAALHKVADMMPDEIGSEYEQRLSDHLTAAHNALHRVGAGQPHAKSPAESRADEIEVEAARDGSKLRFTEALRHAREAWEDVGLAVGSNGAAARKLDTAAWLIVAQRILAREADR